MTVVPYRLVVQNGGVAYQNATFNTIGFQIIVDAGGVFGSSSGLILSPGLPNFVTSLKNSGTVVLNGSITNGIAISSAGLFCLNGSYENVIGTGGCVNNICNRYMDTPTDYFTDGSYATAGDATACMSTTTLPVELIAFDLSLNGGEVEITWVTGSEINNDYFEVLVSDDGVNWETLAVVNGAGNSFDVNSYSVVDDSEFAFDKKYFKLKQVDFDGKVNYSKTKVISLEQQAFIERAYDDGQYLHVFYSGQSLGLELSLYDVNAKSIKLGGVFYLGGNTNHLMVEKKEITSPGIYFIQLKDGSKSHPFKLIIK